MEYKVVTVIELWSDEAYKEFEEKVNKHIRDGWIPKGGVDISPGRFTRFSQAMIRHQDRNVLTKSDI